MSTSAIGNISSSYLQELLASAVQSAGVSVSAAASNTSGAASSQQSDSSRLSPFAQLASTLQQLQQSNPTEYKQVTAQIATNLQSAAQTAQSEGNSGAATQLTQLATDFTNASQTGQLPNLQDLAQAVSGGSGGRHHHHHRAESSSNDSSSAGSGAAASSSFPASSSSTSSPSQALSQLLSSLFQTSDSQSTQNTSTDPTSIILQTLAKAGINVSNS
jgi:hypothetical protein